MNEKQHQGQHLILHYPSGSRVGTTGYGNKPGKGTEIRPPAPKRKKKKKEKTKNNKKKRKKKKRKKNPYLQ